MLIPSGETVVEEKSCRSCGISFVVTDRDMEFYDKVSPVFAGRKESIPTPTLCPECRQRRRLVWRNERRFYRRTSDATGKPILSIYRPDAVMPVYELSEWQKREFDIRELAPDLSGSVFSQIRCLQSSMPRPHLHAVENENCEYVNQSRSSKDCYLAFLTDHSRDCLYTQGVLRGEDMVDVHISVDSRRCYECNHVDRCSDLYFSSFCVDCRDSWFISDCRGCHHCFGSAGLVDASYVFRGERLSPDEYERRIAGLDRRDLYGFIDTERHMLDDAVRSIPHPQLRGHANEDCTGDFVSESRNSHACYTCERVEDCKYCDNLRDVRTSYDWDYVGYGGELSYECLGTGTGIYRALFCAHIWGNARNIYYCDLCMNVEDCFACV